MDDRRERDNQRLLSQPNVCSRQPSIYKDALIDLIKGQLQIHLIEMNRLACCKNFRTPTILLSKDLHLLCILVDQHIDFKRRYRDITSEFLVTIKILGTR